MTDKVQKIREEVARIQLYTQSEVLKQVLDYIDEVQEEPVSEDLEEAASKYADNADYVYADVSIEDFTVQTFKEGAQWQQAKDQSTIELAEDHAMLAGMEKMKEEMMKDAVIGLVHPCDETIWISKKDLSAYHEDEKVNVIIRKIEEL